MDLAEKEFKKRKLKVIVAYGYAGGKIKNILKKRRYEKGNKFYEYIKWIE